MCIYRRGWQRDRHSFTQQLPFSVLSLNVNFRGSQQHCNAHGEGSANCDLYEAELDVRKEKRSQKYLIAMVTIFAICLCPLMVLRYVQGDAIDCDLLQTGPNVSNKEIMGHQQYNTVKYMLLFFLNCSH